MYFNAFHSLVFALSRFWVVFGRFVPCGCGAVRAVAARGRCETPAPGIATVEKAAPMSRHGSDAAPTARLCLRHDSPVTRLSAADIDCSFHLAFPGYVRITSRIKTTFDSYFWKKELVTCRSLRDCQSKFRMRKVGFALRNISMCSLSYLAYFSSRKKLKWEKVRCKMGTIIKCTGISLVVN